ncbi:MAG: glycosyl transferase [Ramlibacter sp.]|nr:glycosyl transferase [Ramlibacter sp.]
MKKKLHIFTSAACNYVPKVRMLFSSLRQHHPEAVLHLLLSDERTELLDLSKEPFDEVTSLRELGIEHLEGWIFCHTIVELSTAIKPFFLRQLLEREDCGKVLYLDPDTVVFSRLDDILNALDEANLVLTPHQTAPEQDLEAVLDNEISSLKHGVFNLGFIGVTNSDESRRFAAWWASRLYYFCRSEIHNGLFTDQRWIDLVPAFFDGVAIMRTGRHNVATWNITTRELSCSAEGQYLVDGEPLGFYHFTGFDSGAHRVMAVKNAGGNAALHGLVDWYERSTAELASDPLSRISWKFACYSDGTSIDKVHRFLYRQRTDLQKAFPDPFDTKASRNLKAWMTTQGPQEYPALFAGQTRDAAMLDLSRHVGLVFDPTENARKVLSLWSMLGTSLLHPRAGSKLIRRGYQILKTEGWKGLSRRLG